MKKFLTLIFLFYASSAFGQSSPNWPQGFTPSAAQWKQAWSSKQDVLNYSALNKAGDSMQGSLGLAPYAITDLPACSSLLVGKLAYVTNGVASPAYRDTVSTTGSTNQIVWCDGANWTYH